MIVSRNLHNMYAVPAYRIQENERKKKKKIETMKAKQLKNFLIVNKSMKSKQLKNSQLGLAAA